MSKKSKKEMAIDILCPDDNGYSNIHWIDEFVSKYPELTMGNGGDWCRDDGSLGKDYIIKRLKGSEYPEQYERLKPLLKLGNKNAIVGIKLEGKKKNSQRQEIRKDIHERVRKLNCSILDIGSRIEVDHKDGRKDDSRVISVENQVDEDFQSLSKAANMAKKTHCKRCKVSGKRYDAKKLGYSVSQVFGDMDYKGSCVGCYWYDPIAFNKEISASYIKKHEDNDIILEIVINKEKSLRIKPIILFNLDYINEETLSSFKNMKVNEEMKVKNNQNQSLTVKRLQ